MITPKGAARTVLSDRPSQEKETVAEALERLCGVRRVEEHEQHPQDEAWDCKECLEQNLPGSAACDYCGAQRGKGRLEWARSDASWESRDGKVYLPPPELAMDSECSPAKRTEHCDSNFSSQWILWIQRRWLHRKCGLIFQDQGTQQVMMLCGGHGPICSAAKLQSYAAKANEILGYDLMDLCKYGPEEDLHQPKRAQPATFLAGMVGFETLKETNPAAAENPRCVAGRSVGEYTALCVAGVFTFEQGLHLVSVRGRAMQEAAQASCGGSFLWRCSVFGLEQEHIDRICKESTAGNDVATVSEVMFPTAFMCSGTEGAIIKVRDACTKARAQYVKMQSGRGTHGLSLPSPLMNTAQAELEDMLNKMVPEMKPPKCDVYMNVTGSRIKAGTPPSEIVQLLSEQLTNPVLWEHSLRSMIEDEVNTLYDIGPAKQLTGTLRRIKPKMSERITSIQV